MKKMRFVVVIFLVLCSGAAFAQHVRLGIDAAGMIPVGNLSNEYGFGIGGLLRLEVEPLSGFAITGRSGYIQHLTKSIGPVGANVDAKLGELPILAGAKFYTDAGIYGALEVGGTYINPSLSVSTSNFAYSSSAFYASASAGGGLLLGPVDIGARLHSFDLGHIGDTLEIGITVGLNFFSL